MSDPRMTGTKECSKCKRDLPVICFSVCKRNKDGLRCECRDCDSISRKKKTIKNKPTKNIIGKEGTLITQVLRSKYFGDPL